MATLEASWFRFSMTKESEKNPGITVRSSSETPIEWRLLRKRSCETAYLPFCQDGCCTSMSKVGSGKPWKESNAHKCGWRPSAREALHAAHIVFPWATP